MTAAVTVAQSGAPGVSLGFKNRIINGGMTIDQRNAGASVSAYSGTYTLDRWRSWATVASKYTVQQNAGSVTPPIGFVNYLGVTSISANTPGSTDEYIIQQFIEGYNTADLMWGTANAKSVTLSFQVYSSLTGTFSGAIHNASNDRSYPFIYTVSSANTWTAVAVTIPGDTTGTWLTTNGRGLNVIWDLGSGSAVRGTAGAWVGGSINGVTGSVNVLGTNGATFYITGVQLEVGTAATQFEFRDYGRELIMCQRYCYGQNNSAGQAYYWFGMSGGTGPSTATGMVQFPVTMRAKPSATFNNASNFYLDGYVGGSFTSASADQMGVNGGGIVFSGGSGGAAGYGGRLLSYNTAAAYIIWSAEL